MTTNLIHLSPRLDASGRRSIGRLAETFDTHQTAFEASQAKHVLNAAITGSGGNRYQQRQLHSISNAMRTGEALAGGTSDGATPVTFDGGQCSDNPGMFCPDTHTQTAGCRGTWRRQFRAGGRGTASAWFHDRLIGRQLSGPGGFDAAC